MSVTLPVVIMLLILSVDFGRAVNEYLSLSEIAYEASRSAARDTKFKDLYVSSGVTRIEITDDLRGRVETILNSYRKGDDPSLDLSRPPTFDAFFNTETNQIEITMRKKVNLTLLLGSLGPSIGTELPISVRVQGPYLYPRSE